MNTEKLKKFLIEAYLKGMVHSKDPERKVGCLFIDPTDYTILTSGYNGFPRGFAENDDRWSREKKYPYVIHAEANGILMAAKKGVRLEGSFCIVSKMPCLSCAVQLVQVGVKGICCPTPNYDHPRWGEQYRQSTDLFSECGVSMVNVDPKELIFSMDIFD